jgi:nucleoside-diphosphate-sugar epimerase
MVVGSGMIAKAFHHYNNNDEIVIFASGVSNSKEDNDSLFEKEKNLLLHTRFNNVNKKFIYFSTVSVNDKSLSNSKYIKHKIDMENVLSTIFSNYIIFRLPNIIGNTDNNNTFFNFFKNKIKNNEEIQIQKDASRYIIDMDDIIKYLQPIIDSNLKNKTINVCFEDNIKMTDLIENFEKIMNVSANKKIIDGGCDYVVDNEEFMSLIKPYYKKNDSYVFQTIEKYINV